MQINVVVMGHLIDDLPNEGIGFDGSNLEVEENILIPDLAAKIGLPSNSEFFVMVNETHLANDEWPNHRLASSDMVVFCPPLKGG